MAEDPGIIPSTPAFKRIAAATKVVEGWILGHPPIRRRQPKGGGAGPDLLYTTTSNWVNAAGDGCYVPGNPTDDWLGTTVDTSTTDNIYLPREGSLYDPNVLSGKIIRAAYDATGRLNMVGKFLDGTIAKSVRMWEGVPDDLATDKPGWDILARVQEKFLVGYKCGSGDYGATACMGGYKWHGLTENNHTIHCIAHTHCVLTGMNCVDANLDSTIVARFDSTDSGAANFAALNVDHDGPYNTSQDTDNRPPWCTVFWIIRANNAGA